MAAYRQDYDGKFPRLTSTNGIYTFDPPFNQPHGWASEIYAYIRTVGHYQCPSEPSPPAKGDNIAGGAGFTDYFFNANLNGNNTFSSEDGINESELQAPSLTVLVGESGWSGSDDLSANGCSMSATEPLTPCLLGPGAAAQFSLGSFSADGFPPFVLTSAATRHLNGANYVFVDGHAKWFKGQAYTNIEGNIASFTPDVFDARVPSLNGYPTFGR